MTIGEIIRHRVFGTSRYRTKIVVNGIQITVRGDFAAWLGHDGYAFFKGLYDSHGRLAVVFRDRGHPHIVHFREGMSIRNWMRANTDAPQNQLDELWEPFVLTMLKLGDNR